MERRRHHVVEFAQRARAREAPLVDGQLLQRELGEGLGLEGKQKHARVKAPVQAAIEHVARCGEIERRRHGDAALERGPGALLAEVLEQRVAAE